MNSQIVHAEAWLLDLAVEAVRVDSMQEFVKQETIFVRLVAGDGTEGIGYSYTIGTGGQAVLSLLNSVLLDAVVGLDAQRPEAVWDSLVSCTRATTIGPITSLALAAIDTAVWDLRCVQLGQPLWKLAGGARSRVQLYSTESGWLHLTVDELVAGAIAEAKKGFRGIKIKVGMDRLSEDVDRLLAVREAVGSSMDIMVDANQCFTSAEAIRRARAFEPFELAWFEEPLPADDLAGHALLSRSTVTPIAVGESLYSVGQFAQYIQAAGASILQPDVARIGGITPWLKVAHLAEAHNLAVAPHFLMELHISLASAVRSATYVEWIPQLSALTKHPMQMVDGQGVAPDLPGLGIPWDREALLLDSKA